MLAKWPENDTSCLGGWLKTAYIFKNRGLLAARGIVRDQIMIIDGEIVTTGSFDFTRADEERNAENHLMIRKKTTGTKYIENWHDQTRH
ncbi:MAG: phospholipase D-like domain-containing protein [Thermodesulfobacteriota bacterium]